MPPRTRTRADGLVSCTGTWSGAPQTWAWNSHNERCDDVTGNYGGMNPLSILNQVAKGSLHVKLNSSGLEIPLPGAPTAWYGLNWNPTIAGEPSPASLVNRLLANTGPLTPGVNLPLFIYELKDVPHMLKHAGDLLHKIKPGRKLDPVQELAASNLAYKFGWAPLIEDLGKLLDFSDAVRRKQKQLTEANSSKGLRRKVNLGYNNQSHTVNNALLWSTFGVILRASYTGVSISKTWGTVHWTVRDPSKYGTAPTYVEAFKTALGLNPGMIPIDVWKALPWSWMADWFTDISNIMIANYNSIYYKPSRLCIMRHTVGKLDHKPVFISKTHYLTGGTYLAELKTRYVNLSPSTNFTLRAPFMDSYKLSVLGSLAILKGKGISRS